MELRTLKYFLAIVRENNISRAAEALHITQPTLSRQIAQLEEETGPLFVRGRRLALTDAGIILRRRAEEIVALVEKTEDELISRDEIGGVISVGCGGLMSFRELAPVMTSFRAKHPAVSFRLYSNSAEYVKEQLESGVLDFGLLLEPVDIAKFDFIRMKSRERWGLLVSAAHPLAQKESVTKNDLIRETLATSSRQPVQGEIESWIGLPLSSLDILATHNLVVNSAVLVESGAVCALGVEGASDLYDPARVVFRPLCPELIFSSVFAWKKGHTGLGAAGRFLEYFKSMH